MRNRSRTPSSISSTSGTPEIRAQRADGLGRGLGRDALGETAWTNGGQVDQDRHAATCTTASRLRKVGSLRRADGAHENRDVPLGSPCPDFRLPAVDGTTVARDDSATRPRSS
jgi:hypothetical protein